MLKTIIAAAREKRWRLQYRKEFTPLLVEASIDTHDWTILFRLDPTAEDSLLALGIDSHEQKTLAAGLVHHEIGHWEVCPYDSEGDYSMVEAVGKTLKALQVKESPHRLNRKTQHMVNAVADIIVDTALALESTSSGYADAQALFYLKALGSPQSLDPFYRLFMELNLQLWGERTELKQRVISRLVGSSDAQLLEDALVLFPHRHEPENLAEWLRNRSNWPKLAGELTEVFLRLADWKYYQDWWRPSPIRNPLRSLYEKRTENVKLKTAGGDAARPLTWPHTPYLPRPVDPVSAPPMESIAWCQTLCLPSSGGNPRILLQQTEANMPSPTAPIRGKGQYSDMAFLVDSSGSMDFDPFGGTGQYDTLLRAVFSAFQWLRSEGVVSYLKYAVVNFSQETRYSQWRDWNSRDALFDTLLDYQGAGTSLDMEVMRQLAWEARGSFVAIMITDGAIDNEGALRRLILDHFRPGNFILIQLGNPGSLARQLKQHGYTVHSLRDHLDLRGLVIGELEQRCRKESK